MSKPAATTTAGPARAPADDRKSTAERQRYTACQATVRLLSDAAVLALLDVCVGTPAARRGHGYRVASQVALAEAVRRGI